MSKLPIFEHFLNVENLKPKLKWFFKPKLKPNLFLLNWVPVAEGVELELRHGEHDVDRVAVAERVLVDGGGGVGVQVAEPLEAAARREGNDSGIRG